MGRPVTAAVVAADYWYIQQGVSYSVLLCTCVRLRKELQQYIQTTINVNIRPVTTAEVPRTTRVFELLPVRHYDGMVDGGILVHIHILHTCGII